MVKPLRQEVTAATNALSALSALSVIYMHSARPDALGDKLRCFGNTLSIRWFLMTF